MLPGYGDVIARNGIASFSRLKGLGLLPPQQSEPFFHGVMQGLAWLAREDRYLHRIEEDRRKRTIPLRH